MATIGNPFLNKSPRGYFYRYDGEFMARRVFWAARRFMIIIIILILHYGLTQLFCIAQQIHK